MELEWSTRLAQKWTLVGGKNKNTHSGRVGNVDVDTLSFFNLSASLACGIGMVY